MKDQFSYQKIDEIEKFFAKLMRLKMINKNLIVPYNLNQASYLKVNKQVSEEIQTG